MGPKMLSALCVAAVLVRCVLAFHVRRPITTSGKPLVFGMLRVLRSGDLQVWNTPEMFVGGQTINRNLIVLRSSSLHTFPVELITYTFREGFANLGTFVVDHENAFLRLHVSFRGASFENRGNLFIVSRIPRTTDRFPTVCFSIGSPILNSGVLAFSGGPAHQIHVSVGQVGGPQTLLNKRLLVLTHAVLNQNFHLTSPDPACVGMGRNSLLVLRPDIFHTANQAFHFFPGLGQATLRITGSVHAPNFTIRLSGFNLGANLRLPRHLRYVAVVQGKHALRLGGILGAGRSVGQTLLVLLDDDVHPELFHIQHDNLVYSGPVSSRIVPECWPLRRLFEMLPELQTLLNLQNQPVPFEAA